MKGNFAASVLVVIGAVALGMNLGWFDLDLVGLARTWWPLLLICARRRAFPYARGRRQAQEPVVGRRRFAWMPRHSRAPVAPKRIAAMVGYGGMSDKASGDGACRTWQNLWLTTRGCSSACTVCAKRPLVSPVTGPVQAGRATAYGMFCPIAAFRRLRPPRCSPPQVVATESHRDSRRVDSLPGKGPRHFADDEIVLQPPVGVRRHLPATTIRFRRARSRPRRGLAGVQRRRFQCRREAAGLAHRFPGSSFRRAPASLAVPARESAGAVGPRQRLESRPSTSVCGV